MNVEGHKVKKKSSLRNFRRRLETTSALLWQLQIPRHNNVLVRGQPTKLLINYCDFSPTFLLILLLNSVFPCVWLGRNSVGGIATGYGLDGPGIESQWMRDFPHPSWLAVGPLAPLYSGYRVFFRRVERPGRGVDFPHQFSAEVKERVELYHYSYSGPSWPILW